MSVLAQEEGWQKQKQKQHPHRFVFSPTPQRLVLRMRQQRICSAERSSIHRLRLHFDGSKGNKNKNRRLNLSRSVPFRCVTVLLGCCCCSPRLRRIGWSGRRRI